MVRSVAGNLPEQVKNNQSVNTAAGNGGQKMSQYSWFTVYVHSKLGQKLLQECQEKMIFRKADVDLALPPSADSRKSVRVHKNRKRFFTFLQKGKDMQSLVKLTEDTQINKIILRVKHEIKMLLIKFGIIH